jgi:beta-lactamase class C
MRLPSRLLFAGLLANSAAASGVLADSDVQKIVADEVRRIMPDRDVGAAVAVVIDGRTLFLNFGWAERALKRPITQDSLFNLASVGKVFDATLLSLAVTQNDVALDDPAAKYVAELQHSGDARDITLGQLATFTSGFSLPQDQPPWPAAHYTWRRFVHHLAYWKRDADHPPGRNYIYSHAGYLLLHVALERRFGMPYSELLRQRLLQPLELFSTSVPPRGTHSVGRLSPTLRARAVQGYSGDGKPIGRPGNVQGFYHWPGTEQMFSSTRDLAKFLAVQLGEGQYVSALRQAMALTHQPVAQIRPGVMQGQAWEVHQAAEIIIGKNGGLNNASSFIGMILNRRLGLVLLSNQGDLNAWDIGYPILLRLAEGQKMRS